MKLPEIPKPIFKGIRKFIQACLNFMQASRPIDGAEIKWNEMPGGMQPVLWGGKDRRIVVAAAYQISEGEFEARLINTPARVLPVPPEEP